MHQRAIDRCMRPINNANYVWDTTKFLQLLSASHSIYTHREANQVRSKHRNDSVAKTVESFMHCRLPPLPVLTGHGEPFGSSQLA